MNYYDWQKECLNAWIYNNCRGIANVVTGAGKTALALAAIEYLEKSHAKLKVKIIVPQTFLLSQWTHEIIRHTGARRDEIGVYSGKHKDTDKKYMIYVVNSARYSFSKHILADICNGSPVLVIADECHHYTSEENAKVFDFYPLLPSSAAYFALGLSATPETANYEAITTPLGNEIYKYGFVDALNAQIISKFTLLNIAVAFTPDEADTYDELSDRLLISFAKLKKLCPELKRLSGNSFFAALQRLAGSAKNSEIAVLASTVLTLSYERKSVVHLAEQRVLCAVKLIEMIEAQSKIIVFCERIETAERIFGKIKYTNPEQVGIYHSEMEHQARKQALERYSRSEIRILICCKALDEGLNVPSTDVGIVVSTSGSERQRIQRLGRLLRRSGGTKRLFYIYVSQSSEDRELLAGMTDTFSGIVPMMNLDFEENRIRYDEYEKLCANVLAYVGRVVTEPGVIAELRRNLELGAVRLDWWLSESECRNRIVAAKTVSDRNYWKSVLYVILERLGKL